MKQEIIIIMILILIIITNLCKLLSTIMVIIAKYYSHADVAASGNTEHLDKICKYLFIGRIVTVEVALKFSKNCLRLQAWSRIPTDATKQALK